MYTLLKSSPNSNRVIKISSTGNLNYLPTNIDRSQERHLSKVGSSSYIRSQRRAFARAKALAFFNPDLTTFITLTYADNMTDTKKAMQDFKDMIKRDKTLKTSPNNTNQPLNHGTSDQFKYIYVFETQKRGAIHFHIIANNYLTTHLNQNGYPSISAWTHGISNVQTIAGTDVNFKPYLYLFKYMHKSQRVGYSFIHVSRNFAKITTVDYYDYIERLSTEGLLYQEDYDIKIDRARTRITKEYFETRTTRNKEKEIPQ